MFRKIHKNTIKVLSTTYLCLRGKLWDGITIFRWVMLLSGKAVLLEWWLNVVPGKVIGGETLLMRWPPPRSMAPSAEAAILEFTFILLLLLWVVGVLSAVVTTTDEAIFLNFLWVYIPADSSHLCSTGSTAGIVSVGSVVGISDLKKVVKKTTTSKYDDDKSWRKKAAILL